MSLLQGGRRAGGGGVGERGVARGENAAAGAREAGAARVAELLGATGALHAVHPEQPDDGGAERRRLLAAHVHHAGNAELVLLAEHRVADEPALVVTASDVAAGVVTSRTLHPAGREALPRARERPDRPRRVLHQGHPAVAAPPADAAESSPDLADLPTPHVHTLFPLSHTASPKHTSPNARRSRTGATSW